jgi:hypothetical protein
MMTTVTLAHHAWHEEMPSFVGLERTTRTVMELAVSLARLEELTLTTIRPPNVLNARLGSSRPLRRQVTILMTASALLQMELCCLT